MKILCISTSNTKDKGEDSTSTKVCYLIQEMIQEKNRDTVVQVEALMDYEFTNCCFCGNCIDEDHCKSDDDYNRLYQTMKETDAFFMVVPHYSPIPSKLIMLFEKMNELFYANYIKHSDYKSPFYNKPIGVIGHGGMVQNIETLNYYHDYLVKPVANTLRSLSFQVVGVDNHYQDGAVFGLKDGTCYKKEEDHIYPNIIQDYDLIKEQISPLVTRLMTIVNKD